MRPAKPVNSPKAPWIRANSPNEPPKPTRPLPISSQLIPANTCMASVTFFKLERSVDKANRSTPPISPVILLIAYSNVPSSARTPPKPTRPLAISSQLILPMSCIAVARVFTAKTITTVSKIVLTGTLTPLRNFKLPPSSARTPPKPTRPLAISSQLILPMSCIDEARSFTAAAMTIVSNMVPTDMVIPSRNFKAATSSANSAPAATTP